MKEFKDWENDELMDLYKIIDTAHKSKMPASLSKILDELSDLRELLGAIPIEKIQKFLKKLVDEMIDRDEGIKEFLGNQENT